MISAISVKDRLKNQASVSGKTMQEVLTKSILFCYRNAGGVIVY